MNLRKILCLVVIPVALIGCKKHPGNDNNKVESPIPNSETVKAFFISATERGVNGFGERAFTVFNANGSIRWKKMGRGNATAGHTSYSNGIIISAEPDMNTGNLYAFDISTGNEIWSRIGSAEHYYYPIVRNDILFCSTKITTSATGSIAAFNAKTGALYWRKFINTAYYGVNLLVLLFPQLILFDEIHEALTLFLL